MTGTQIMFGLAAIGALLLLSACCAVEQLGLVQGPIATATAASTPISTDLPSADSPAPATDTPPPTATETPLPTSTLLPTATTTPASTVVRVAATRVVYHDGIEQDGVGIYTKGTLPWLDLLARLGDTWYGPEREPDDGIDAQPLPEGYRWECGGGFSCHPNGEAWWNETNEEGTARLVGPGGAVLAEVALKVAFREGGDGGPPPAFSTSAPGS